MKKLIIAASLLVGSFCFQAYATAPVLPVNADATVVLQDTYKEIKVTEVPTAVTDAFEKDFPGATIDKAYVNEEKKYKLDVSTAEGSITLYANEKGEWIEE